MRYACLIVDHREYSVRSITGYCQRFGKFKVVRSYTDPFYALEEITKMERMADLIIMNIGMPTMSGLELSKEIRHKTHRLILSTAYYGYPIDRAQLGVDAILLKPFSYEEFAGKVQSVLRGIK